MEHSCKLAGVKLCKSCGEAVSSLKLSPEGSIERKSRACHHGWQGQPKCGDIKALTDHPMDTTT